MIYDSSSLRLQLLSFLCVSFGAACCCRATDQCFCGLQVFFCCAEPTVSRKCGKILRMLVNCSTVCRKALVVLLSLLQEYTFSHNNSRRSSPQPNNRSTQHEFA